MTRARVARLAILAGTVLSVAMLFASLLREILRHLGQPGAGMP